MKDRYVEFVNSGLGKSLANSVGLPQPVKLNRYEPGSDFINDSCLLGAAAGSELFTSVAKVLENSDASIFVDTSNAELSDLLKNDKLAAKDLQSTAPDKLGALVFDASGIKNSDQLIELYNFFHPVIRKLGVCSRIVILGRIPELCEDPKYRTAQRALEGFIRSTAKEVKDGGTSQLLYVAPGAENLMESSVRFFLSSKSAYVSAQVVRLHPSKVESSDIDWNQPLKGQVALVTGAARGIGAAIAKVMARDGAQVICLDIPPAEKDLQQVSEEIGGSYLAMDITAEDTPQKLADYFSNEHKGLDILVHNAGVTRDKTIAKMSEQFWNMALDINLSSEERINDLLLEKKVINPGGRIVCVSSISGIAGNRGQTNYATSKAGVIGMVQSMSPILGEDKITINAVAPGFIETQMTAAMPMATREGGRRLNSLSQGGLPVDVAETIAWFSNPNSQGVTGNIVRVCGQSLLGA